MKYPVLVRILQCGRDLHRDGQQLRLGQRTAGQFVGKTAAGDQLGYQEVDAVLGIEVEDGRDVGMAKP